MSIKKIEEVKSSKWFRIFDVICYGVIAAALVALFLVLMLRRDNGALTGFNVIYGGKTVYTYEFSSGRQPEGNEYIKVGESTAEGFYIRFEADGEYNDIYVDLKSKSVSVTDSNCSRHKDCVYTAALTKKSSTPIICTPHTLTISPINFIDDGNVST